MNFSSPHRQRMIACLALVSMLLLFIAPVISKNVRENTLYEMPNSEAMHHAHMLADMPIQSVAHHHHEMDIDSDTACGYCDLLIHLPLMLWALSPVIWLLRRLGLTPPTPLNTSLILRRYHGVKRPRAPPLLLLS